MDTGISLSFSSSLKAIETAALRSLILEVSCVSMILLSFGVATLILIIPGAVVSDDVDSDAAAGAVDVPHADGRTSCLTGGSPHLLLRG